jgi:hypothetical protein
MLGFCEMRLPLACVEALLHAREVVLEGFTTKCSFIGISATCNSCPWKDKILTGYGEISQFATRRTVNTGETLTTLWAAWKFSSNKAATFFGVFLK